jgi:exopolyphosphatase/pppGpp-phosphohydrolase
MENELKELKQLAMRIEDKMDKRLDRLEDKVDSKFLEINKEISAFKRFTFGVILGISGTIEALKHKMGF